LGKGRLCLHDRPWGIPDIFIRTDGARFTNDQGGVSFDVAVQIIPINSDGRTIQPESDQKENGQQKRGWKNKSNPLTV